LTVVARANFDDLQAGLRAHQHHGGQRQLRSLVAPATVLPDAQVPGWVAEPAARDTRRMVDDHARELAIYHGLKAVDEVAAALQAHLLEEHKADLERAAVQSTFTNSLKLLRQARERLGEGLRAVGADNIAASDDISLRNEQPTRATDV
jgi:hypothetical protein